MRRLQLTITAMLLSVLLAVPAIAGQGEPPSEMPKKAGKPNAAGQKQVEKAKPGTQLDELRKRMKIRDRAAAKRRQMMNTSGGQQSQ